MHFTCPKLTRNFFFNSIMRDISTLSHINLRNICYLHQLFKCYRFLDILCHILSCQVTRILIQCEYNFKVCQSVHHHTFQINQPTRCKNFSSLLFDVYVKLNMFRASSRPSSGAQQLQQQPLVLPLERGGSSAVGRDRAGRSVGSTTTNSTLTTMLQR